MKDTETKYETVAWGGQWVGEGLGAEVSAV